MNRTRSSMTCLMRSCLTFLLVSSLSFVYGNECQSSDAQQSCGQCIKQSVDCVWCQDPGFSGESRCDLKDNLMGKCQPTYIFSPEAKIDKFMDYKAGSVKASDSTTIQQTQPQGVRISLRLGETVSFPFYYYHTQNTVFNVHALNSHTDNSGVDIKYTVECKGRQIPGNVCEKVSFAETVTFNVSITLTSCDGTGDTVISVGISGARDVAGIYVTPLCGCECEKLEKAEVRSRHCNTYGTLVCGMCNCLEGWSGNKCQCDARRSSPQDMEQCRASPREEYCSGKGDCSCGRCACNTPQITGRFCECDSRMCNKGINGQVCSGQGQCECRGCKCNEGFEGDDCHCPKDTHACVGINGQLCSGHGECSCAKCTCESEYSGPTCEVEPAREPVREPEPEQQPEPEPKNEPEPEPQPEEELPEDLEEEWGGEEETEEPESEPNTDSDPEAEPETAGTSALRWSLHCLLPVFLACIYDHFAHLLQL